MMFKKLVAWLLPLALLLPFQGLKLLKEDSFPMPGLADGFVPQGICTDGEHFFISGYYPDGTESCIWVTDERSGRVLGCVRLEGYTGHAGGIALCGDRLYIASGSKIRMLDREEVLAHPGGKAAFRMTYPVHTNASFITCAPDGTLWVGEYRYRDTYTTDPTHGGAWLAGYATDADGLPVLTDERLLPTAVVSIPDKVQGVSFLSDGVMALSVSAGLQMSELLLVPSPKGSAPDTVEVGGVAVPHYTRTEVLQRIYLPPMLEETAVLDGRLYLVFESAARKFPTHFFGLKNVYAIDPSAAVRQAAIQEE